MFNHCTSSTLLLLLTAGVALSASTQGKSGDASSHKAALAAIQPRLLWNRRPDSNSKQPIIIVQQPNADGDSERHHHRRPHWDYYPYPAPPQQPQRPPFQIPGLNDYLNGGGASIIIINPNNAQNLSFPAAAAAPAATTPVGGRSGLRNQIAIADLLQGLGGQDSILADDSDVIRVAENESEAAAAAQAPMAQYGSEEHDEDTAEDELALLERQAARGLSTKHLLSFLLQDKRRRHFQEAVAGIYLRNYNQNRK